MKTDELVSMLSAQVEPAPRRAALRRVLAAGLAGVLLGALWMALEFGVRDDLVSRLRDPGFWGKLVLPAWTAVAGAVLAQRLGRPGVTVGGLWWTALLPVGVVWSLAMLALAQAPPEQRWPLVLGQTWQSCALNIALLSVPAFVAVLLAMRSLAPTRPVMAGAAAGLMAGGIGALVYALHCPESEAPFLAVWYVAGMGLAVVAGAALGPRVMRW